jgi:hypothetical protein
MICTEFANGGDGIRKNICCKARNGASVAPGLNGEKQLLAFVFGVDSRRFCQIEHKFSLKIGGTLE